MDLSLFFAGTAGSVPSARRGLPALLLRAGGDRLLFDCGEGTQQQLLRSIGLPELDAVFSCGGSDSPEGWVQLSDVDDEEVGRLACSIDADGDPQLRWYWEDIGVLGFAELRGGGAEALSDLQSWWTDNADRGF